MGMLFARRKREVKGLTTTESLLPKKEPKKVENVKPQSANIPTQRVNKFKV